MMINKSNIKDGLILHSYRINSNNPQDELKSLPFDLTLILRALNKSLKDTTSVEWVTNTKGEITDFSIYFMPKE